jgi:hypothetical protein
VVVLTTTTIAIEHFKPWTGVAHVPKRALRRRTQSSAAQQTTCIETHMRRHRDCAGLYLYDLWVWPRCEEKLREDPIITTGQRARPPPGTVQSGASMRWRVVVI